MIKKDQLFIIFWCILIIILSYTVTNHINNKKITKLEMKNQYLIDTSVESVAITVGFVEGLSEGLIIYAKFFSQTKSKLRRHGNGKYTIVKDPTWKSMYQLQEEAAYEFLTLRGLMNSTHSNYISKTLSEYYAVIMSIYDDEMKVKKK